MSDAYAEIFDAEGNPVGYSVYHGSSDNVSPDISDSIEEAMKVRHRFFGEESGWERARRCTHDGQDGYVLSHYGSERGWNSRLCLECKVIIGDLSPYPPDDI